MNGKKTRKLKKLYILILCSLLFLYACGASDMPIQYEENDIFVEESEEAVGYSDEEQKEFEIENTYENSENYS